jgi:hypothetical protein
MRLHLCDELGGPPALADEALLVSGAGAATQFVNRRGDKRRTRRRVMTKIFRGAPSLSPLQTEARQTKTRSLR